MVAPIDATATIDAGEEQIELRLNFRTMALAAEAGVDLLAGDAVQLDAYAMVRVIAAFAKPAQPDFDEEQAFALVVSHGAACGEAVTQLLKSFSAAMPKGGAASPRKRRQESAPAS